MKFEFFGMRTSNINITGAASKQALIVETVGTNLNNNVISTKLEDLKYFSSHCTCAQMVVVVHYCHTKSLNICHFTDTKTFIERWIKEIWFLWSDKDGLLDIALVYSFFILSMYQWYSSQLLQKHSFCVLNFSW